MLCQFDEDVRILDTRFLILNISECLAGCFGYLVIRTSGCRITGIRLSGEKRIRIKLREGCRKNVVLFDGKRMR